MNPPADKALCLAHNPDCWPHLSRTPPAWCERLTDCIRHQAISQVAPDGSFTIQSRVCAIGTHDAFIARDAVESEGGEA